MRKVTSATLFTPLVIAVGCELLILVDSKKAFEAWSQVLLNLLVLYLLALLVTACVTLPLRYLWRRWDFARVWVSASVGLCVGLVLVAALSFVMTSTPALSSQAVPTVAYVKFGLIGAISGIVFWAIARSEMRPNTALERTRAE